MHCNPSPKCTATFVLTRCSLFCAVTRHWDSQENQKDFEELDDNIKDGMTVHYADYYRDVYDVAFADVDKAPRTL